MDKPSALHKLAFQLIPFSVILLYGLLAVPEDLRFNIPLLLGITGCITVLLFLACYLGEQADYRYPVWIVLTTALVVRLFFLFLPVQLSDDIYRYLWDGLGILDGINPYVNAPAEVQSQAGSRVGLLELVNHPELVTVYPPAAQVIFSIGSALGGQITGMKLLLVIIDLASCLFLVKLCSQMQLSPVRVVLYAWHPLPVLEISHSGHIDGGVVFFLYGGLFLVASMSLRQGVGRGGNNRAEAGLDLRSLFSGLLLSCAIMTKIFPLVFIPGFLLFIGSNRRRVIFLTGVAAGCVLLVLPFLPHCINMMETLSVYGRDWEFGGFLFRSLRGLLDSGLWARFLLGATFFLVVVLVYSRMSGGMKKDLEQMGGVSPMNRMTTAFYSIAFTFLLLTPTLHPWYALYLTCLLPFAAGPAGLVFCWSVFLAYQVQIGYTILGKWVENDMTGLMIVSAPVAAILLSYFYRLNRTPEPMTKIR